MLAKLAILLERLSIKIKKYNIKKQYNKYVKSNKLVDGRQNNKIKQSYNTYEGSNISLIKRLICSGEISKSDYIMDIGCGAGVFISYLLLHGFNHISGIEIDTKLYELCLDNLKQINHEEIVIYNFDALKIDYDDKINVFYLFNPFYDVATYISWIEKVKESYDRNPRIIKIIILFPTISSISALNATEWIKKKCTVIDENQVCAQCVKYLIYESEG